MGDGGSTASAMTIHAGTSNTFSLATFSSSWSSFYYSWVAGNISWMQLLIYATPEYADKYLRGMVVVPLSSWMPLMVSTSPTVPLPSTSTIAGSHSVVSSSRVRLLPARSRSPRRSEGPLIQGGSRENGNGGATFDGRGSHAVAFSFKCF